MSMVRTRVDIDALPDALLTLAKRHIRVDGTYEDEMIRSALARAIGRFQDKNEVALNPATYEWRPASFYCAPRVPVTPVTSFVAKLADNTDVSASYTITTNSVFGVPILYLNGAYQSGVVLTLETGFTPTTLPQSVLDALLRNAAHLHEHREILIPGSEFVSPDIQLDASWWVPRV